MTITTDALIEFFGTQDTITSSEASLADAAFSPGQAWTNADDAPMASVTLAATYSVAPDVGSNVTLFARLLNVQSTNDNETPSANIPFIFLGYFPLNAVTSAQYITVEVRLPNAKSSQEYEFYIQNNGGQTLSANWDLFVTPKTVGPHA